MSLERELVKKVVEELSPIYNLEKRGVSAVKSWVREHYPLDSQERQVGEAFVSLLIDYNRVRETSVVQIDNLFARGLVDRLSEVCSYVQLGQ